MRRDFYIILAVIATLLIVLAAIQLLHSVENESYDSYLNTEGVPVSYASGGECISCHKQVTGLSKGHINIGCTSCHLGNSVAKQKEEAHEGIILIPGNVVNMDQTCGVCHKEAVQNIRASMMTTNSGIVSVDKYIFGERTSPDIPAHMALIGHSAADEHLRNLCSHCHLGNEKTETGPVNQLSRGGGCNACHLNYTAKGKKGHDSYLNDSTLLPSIHPSLDLNITNEHCFGCHSRSGRIATNYEGYHETLLHKDSLETMEGFRVLEDDRVFKYIAEDVHHTKGLLCIDCHTYADVMGDGTTYIHEEDAVKISCEDCHSKVNEKQVVYADSMDLINRSIYSIRQYTHKRLLVTQKGEMPMLNTKVFADNRAVMIGKKDGIEHPLVAPSSACTREFGHKDLTCSSCHTAWAPQCIGCHVDYDPDANGYDLLDKKYIKGSWIEYAGEFLAGPATLGISEKGGEREVHSAIPGMIFTLDQTAFAGKQPVNTSFHRLFAPAAPHTTDSKGRDCKSCHSNPVALGYGHGKLEFDKSTAQWTFTPEYVNLPQDGLPADAWIGFLQEPLPKTSTRLTFRAFSVAEQKKILTVGACLTCHDQNSDLMKESIHKDFKELRAQMTEQCKVPEFD